MRKINIKVKIVILLLVLIGVGLFMVRTRDVLGYTIDTLNITRQIPNPPPPPTKPEPPSPPKPPTPSPKPKPSPTPSPSTSPAPSPTPSPTPGVTPTPPGSPPPGGPVGGPAGCGATVPSAPTLLSATKTGSKAVLSWTAVSEITHYALEYGLSSGNYTYGVTNTGNTTSFTVSDLDPGSNYCFAVRAVNDCAPGDLSNEICTGAVLGAATGQVLGLSTTASGNPLINTLSLLGILCLLLSLKSFLTQKNLI